MPLIELVLQAGADPLSRQPEYPRALIRRYLDHQPGSLTETMVRAFLDVVPEHERSVSLAYLLSQSGRQKSSVKAIFEVFQTVGIKFGQAASLWNLFGPDVSRELASLKENARPMSKAEVEAALTGLIGPHAFRLVRVLGSASIKTVVEIEWDEAGRPRRAVMALQRPQARAQIEANLELGVAFLKRLSELGVDGPRTSIAGFVEDLTEQLHEELDFELEATKVRRAQRVVSKIARLVRNPGGYAIAVPGLIAELPSNRRVLFFEKAEGLPLRYFQPGAMDGGGEDAVAIRAALATYYAEELGAGARLEDLLAGVWRDVAPVAGELALRAGFRAGWFEGDRHVGNFLVDPRARQLSLIDVAQSHEFGGGWFAHRDETYFLARFVRAVAERDLASIARYGLRLRGQRVTPAERTGLRDTLARVDGADFGEFVVGVVDAFNAGGVRLPRHVSFGAIKTLLTVRGEGYLDDAAMARVLGQEVARVHWTRAPRVIWDWCAARLGRN